jgi:hypothetical protein
MNISGLYEIKKWYWLLFPSKDIAAEADARAARLTVADAAAVVFEHLAVSCADYWCRELNCNVSFIELNSMFMLLEKDGKYYKVLSTSGSMGWIIYPENEAWTKNCIEEVKAEQ